jgi:hypothetical protein
VKKPLEIAFLGLLGFLTTLPIATAAPGDNLALVGTAAQSSTGFVDVSSFTLAAGGGPDAGKDVVDIQARGTPGLTLELEASFDLVNWSVIATATAAPGTGALTFRFNQPQTVKHRFYRFRSP